MPSKRRTSPVLRLCLAAVAPCAIIAQSSDVCDGTGVRPIVLVPGFLGSPLYDSAGGYDPEWPDFDAFGQQVAEGATDLDQSMEWNNMTQALGPVGPERFKNDEFPSLDSNLGWLFSQAVYRDIKRIGDRWVHPEDKDIPMFHSVSWDWRRDFYEQAERVMLRLELVQEQTNCRVLLAGHSFGGRLIYTTFARYGMRATETVAGVLYGSAPFHGTAVQMAALSQIPDAPVDATLPPVDTMFTYPSIYVISVDSDTSCFNAPSLFSNDTSECPPDKWDTGINCESEKCGRPKDWPADKPFYLPLDSQSDATWMKIGAANPVLDTVTPTEANHLNKSLITARRATDMMWGPGAAQVQEVHPPAAVISIAVANPMLSYSRMNHYITCDPSDSFGDWSSEEKWCSTLRLGGTMAGDGLMLGYMQELRGPGWDDIVETYRMTTFPKGFPPSFQSPHAGALQLAVKPKTRLVCSNTAPIPAGTSVNTSEFGAGSGNASESSSNPYPTLEQLLCSLIVRADNAMGESRFADPNDNSAAPTSAIGLAAIVATLVTVSLLNTV